MEFVNYLGDKNVASFMLLFARMSGLVLFFPFFSHSAVPVVIKTTLALFLTMYLYPLARLSSLHLDGFLILQLIAELALGMIAGLALQIVFAILMMAGEQVAFVMGFTMASVMDPSSGTNMPLISQILNLIALLFFLAFDGHHLVLLFISQSLGQVNLGDFYPAEGVMNYLNQGIFSIFILGFCLAFPILAISLLADLIFGLLMKTMPQFNLLVIGFPIKIFLGFVVLIAILLVMMQYFKRLIIGVFPALGGIFGW